jgi:alpha-tubulin suppressor-like RCC1 family protein
MIHKLSSLGLAIAMLLLAMSGGTATTVQASAGEVSSTTASSAAISVAQITAGFEHTCVRAVDGSVSCWGSNRYGQLGNADQTIHPFAQPTTISNGPATAIAAGGYHTCAIVSGGAVDCWGLNSSGQLGDGTTTNRSSPVSVSGISGASAIAAGYDYTCALISDSVSCWGGNTYGQLGNGTSGSSTSSATPVAVSGLSGATAITAGFDHTCALLTGGSIQCWGGNAYGQVGNNASGTGLVQTTPVAVDTSLISSATFKAVAAGSQHTCGITNAGSVYCWGDGALGEMGDGKTPPRTKNMRPETAVSGVTDAAAISAGGYADTGHTCALTGSASSHGVVCWGSDVYGQLGSGSVVNFSNTPVTSLASGVSTVAVGVNHTCALINDGSMRCWGSDSSGQLGDGVNSISTTPIAVLGGESGVTQVGTGDRNTCALINAKVYCWGNNRDNQIGDGASINRPGLTEVTSLTGTVTAIDSGMNQTCVIVDGGVQCWGGISASPATLFAAGSGVTSLSVTNLHACAVVAGAVKCWGDDTRGQLGDGNTTGSSATPVQVTSLTSGVHAVVTGQWFSCALMNSNTVSCWGDNTNGQLGTGSASTTPLATPQAVSGLTGIAMITAGQDHACALSIGGAVSCWGNNQQGQLGDGTQTQHPSPNPIPTLATGVTQITAGGFHTCALVNGGVKCWGFNSFGQLGNGTTVISKTPVDVSGLTSGITAVAAGGINYDEEQTCAITIHQALMCWGGDEYGQLGDNLPIMRSSPVKVLGLTGVPELGINYPSGPAGSFFRLAAVNLPASTLLTVDINGHFVGGVTTSKYGYAFFHFHPDSSVTGTVTISLVSGSTTSLDITMTPGGVPYAMEGSGQVLSSVPMAQYLPVINR